MTIIEKVSDHSALTWVPEGTFDRK